MDDVSARGLVMPHGEAYESVKIAKEDGITWVTLNRPEKRNAMSPQLDREMLDVLINLEEDPETRVLVLAGAGDAWCAGMDLALYFRDLERKPAERSQAYWTSHQWRWHKLYSFPKPTIAMVNGYCFGGAFTQLVACDFAIASEDATFGLSEVNWGIIPGGLVSKVLEICLGYRDGLYFGLTGDTFDAKTAATARLINKAVPSTQLRDETVALARKLMAHNPETLRAAKQAMKMVRGMNMDQASDYLLAKDAQLRFRDREGGYVQGIKQFIDDKSYRPGLGPYARPED
jgi:trans-feruloyl-CoA hydratase/vanillin synthase